VLELLELLCVAAVDLVRRDVDLGVVSIDADAFCASDLFVLVDACCLTCVS
jgi:hypothetical protein